MSRLMLLKKTEHLESLPDNKSEQSYLDFSGKKESKLSCSKQSAKTQHRQISIKC